MILSATIFSNWIFFKGPKNLKVKKRVEWNIIKLTLNTLINKKKYGINYKS